MKTWEVAVLVYDMLGNRVRRVENIINDRVVLEKGDLTSAFLFHITENDYERGRFSCPANAIKHIFPILV